MPTDKLKDCTVEVSWNTLDPPPPWQGFPGFIYCLFLASMSPTKLKERSTSAAVIGNHIYGGILALRVHCTRTARYF